MASMASIDMPVFRERYTNHSFGTPMRFTTTLVEPRHEVFGYLRAWARVRRGDSWGPSKLIEIYRAMKRSYAAAEITEIMLRVYGTAVIEETP